MSIKARELAMKFGKIEALAIDSLSLDPGQLYALVGPNGAGKSTLLQLVAGLLKPTSGSVTVDGELPGSIGARRVVSFVPDLPALFDDLTLDDQLHYVARLYKHTSPSDICLDLIERLDADSLLTKFPRAMSKGQRQKASLLVGTARPFSVLLLDEPTTGLDADSRTALIDALLTLARSGVTIVASTHDEELIEAADADLHLIDGRLTAHEQE